MQTEIQQLKKCQLRANKVDRDGFLALSRNPVFLILDGVESAHNSIAQLSQEIRKILD